ncbi:MAG TPA: hypothetical protein VNE71_08985 [Myxococcota bacterium]|nr:hypothetical protein [Myxococcota bacterium]
METLAALGGGAFVLVSLAIGLRLMLLAMRTGELPEFAVGGALLLLGGVGYPAAALARGAPGLGVLPRVTLAAIGMACMVLGPSGIAVFNWKVFRADSPWTRRAVAFFALALVAAFVWQAATPGFLAAAEYRGNGIHALELLTGAVLAWASYESITYAVKMRRRVRVGLADPLVADRVRLWAYAMLAAQLLNHLSIAAVAMGGDLVTWRYGGVVVFVLGLVAALSMWLAFLPPRAYRRYVAARGAA